MTTQDFLADKARTHDARPGPRLPIEIPNGGRDDLAVWFAELGFTKGVEIGVQKGEYSRELLKANPGLHLWSVDPWEVREEYHDRRGQELFDGYEAKARRELGAFNEEGKAERSTILKMKSCDALSHFGRRSLDFVYIDGHHNLLNVIHDIVQWTAKVRPGGIVAGHDFVRHRVRDDIHVVQGVHAYTSSYEISPWYLLGRKSKDHPDEKRDRHRSFLWVRPGHAPNLKSYDPTKGGMSEIPGHEPEEMTCPSCGFDLEGVPYHRCPGQPQGIKRPTYDNPSTSPLATKGG